MKNQSVSIPVFVVAGLLVIALIAMVQGRPSPVVQTGGQVTPPPQALACPPYNHDFMIPFTGFCAEASYKMEGKSVSIVWTQENGKAQKGTQVIRCSYWPTAVSFGPNAEILIGGMMNDGSVVIESLTLGAPQLVNVVATSNLPSYVRIVPSPVETRGTVWQQSSPDFTLARDLTVFSGDPDGIFVYSHSPAQIVRVDRISGAVSVLASPTGDAGLLVPPVSSGAYMSLWYRLHGELGGVLVGVPHNVETALPFVLIDGDSDGTFDSYLEANDATWGALNLAPESAYLD